MKKPLNTIGRKYVSSARVVDGKLILSFPEAQVPVLWQMDLSEAKASAMEVHKRENGHVLRLRTVRGEGVDIASFDSREQGIDGLMAVSRALENAHGHIRLQQRQTAPVQQVDRPMQNRVSFSEEGQPKKWVAGVVGIVFIVVLFAMWGAMAPRPPGYAPAAGAPESSAAATPSGVPMSADDFLKGY